MNAARWRSFYGTGEGKLIAGVHSNGDLIGYSVNGGRNFFSRAVALSARVRAVMFFDARNGYLVGEHGMAYRYRIVPVDYAGAGIIGAVAPSE